MSVTTKSFLLQILRFSPKTIKWLTFIEKWLVRENIWLLGTENIETTLKLCFDIVVQYEMENPDLKTAYDWCLVEA